MGRRSRPLDRGPDPPRARRVVAPRSPLVFDGAALLRVTSLLGLVVLLGLCVALSRDRRAISWRLVLGALGLQWVLGVVFLAWDSGRNALRAFGDGFTEFLGLSQSGAGMVFGPLADGGLVAGVFGKEHGFLFATQVLPTVIFFSAFTAVLYHLGVLQLVVRGMAMIVLRVLGTSGAESLSATANVFVGQTEAPLLVRPFLPRMTKSEIHAVMTGGFATIAGGVFVLYVSFGIDAGALVVASVMAAPGGLMVSKILWPETEVSDTLGTVRIPPEAAEAMQAGNVVEAAANGATDGMRLALNIAAMLIAFLGLIAVANALLAWGGPFIGLDGLSLQGILALVFYPIAWMLGVPGADVTVVAQLLGTKLIATELVAYEQLGQFVDPEKAAGAFAKLGIDRTEPIGARTELITSFALCGFANFGSLAIQIGGLSAMAPDRRPDIAKLALRAMFAGALTTCLTACIAGVLETGPI
jgi:CNT family concentrative nucleoside transporter